MPRILLTGATGYIGSHTWLALQEAGFDVVGVDNFANSSPRVLERLAELGGRTPQFERVDVCDPTALHAVFERHPIDAVVHFAAHKAVGESVQKPLEYYRNNIGGLINTAQVMERHGVRTMVFSSSATVYGSPEKLPITEDAALSATNPYGATKLMGEQLLRDLEHNQPHWRMSYLRYFNPVGAHPSGRIGEHPGGIPNNLMPYVTQVAVGKLEYLRVFGNDYDTPDGTGVRDYIHVVDLAEGHVAALRHLLDGGAVAHAEPRHRPGQQRAGGGASLRGGEWPTGALPCAAAATGRRGGVLCRLLARAAAARLARAPRLARHVCACLGMAARQSARLSLAPCKLRLPASERHTGRAHFCGSGLPRLRCARWPPHVSSPHDTRVPSIFSERS